MNKIILLLMSVLLFSNCAGADNSVERNNRFICQEVVGFPYYDAVKGNVKSVSETDYDLVLEDGKYERYTSCLRHFEYSEDGGIVAYKYENPYENITMKFLYEDGKLVGIDGGGRKLELDGEGNIVKYFPLYDVNPENYYLYRYDGDSRIVSRSNNGADLDLVYVTSFEYDGEGRLIKRTESCGDGPSSYNKFEYNMEDLVWQIEVGEADGSGDVYEFIYEYDDWHNWVSRRKAFASEGDKYYVLTERKIEYY